MANDFNPTIMIAELEEVLKKEGVPDKEAKRQAHDQINSMGATKTLTGNCPLGGVNPMACMFCEYGHMTECHHPQTCEEAECSHYQAEMAGEIVELGEEHAGLFNQGGVSDDTN